MLDKETINKLVLINELKLASSENKNIAEEIDWSKLKKNTASSGAAYLAVKIGSKSFK
ncbi:hypothetical protein IPJ63_02165 [Candidatus Nomurabacteria bacterium]|nr:MAG: hypothetical protein IPJ63_02165 [Candidatus Nomurabacteria bacterium]